MIDIYELLHRFRDKKVEVILCWIRGHAEIIGNKLADLEANEARKLPVVSSQEIPASDVQAYIKQVVYKKWKEEWKQATAAQYKLKEVLPEIMKRPLDVGLGRQDACKLVRLQIGHTRLTHSFFFTREDAPTCVRCRRPLSVKHILVECPELQRQRLVHFNPNVVTYKDLLTKKEWAMKVLQFVKGLGIFYEI